MAPVPAWRRGWQGGALIVLCAALVTLPLFRQGPSCGQDFDFHLQSWLAAHAAWQHGLYWPHWVAAANYGAGEPRLVFYPPVSWMLGAALGEVLPWRLVPAVLTFVALAGSGLTFSHLARASVSRQVAAGAACIYLANPYLLFVVYERTAYGELLGAVTMPLVVLYSLRFRPEVVPLAIVVALLWFTNAPAAVMGCYLLVFCAVAAAAGSRSVLPLGRALAGIVIGTGMAGIYVLPAAYEQRWVEIARAVSEGMRVEDSFLFEHTGEAYHDQVLHTASSIAVGMLAAGLLAGLFAMLLDRGKARRVASAAGTGELRQRGISAEQLYGWTVPGATLGIGFLLLPSSDWVWRTAPKLYFLQFPWRWLLVDGLVVALGFALLAQVISEIFRRQTAEPSFGREARGQDRATRHALRVAAALGLCVGAFGAGRYGVHHYGQFCDEEDNVAAQLALLRPSSTAPGSPPTGFEGTDEYTPVGPDAASPSDNGEIQQGLPAVRLLESPDGDEGDDSKASNPQWRHGPGVHGEIRVEEWAPEHVRVEIEAGSAGYAVLRLLDYPAWRVRVNGTVLERRPHREDGLMTIPVSVGVTSVDVHYGTTTDVWAGRGVSVISLAVLMGLVGVGGRRRRGSRL